MEVLNRSRLPTFEKQAIKAVAIELTDSELSGQAVLVDQVKQDTAQTFNTHTGNTSFNSGDIRVVGIADYKQAASCLAEAFAEDEVARYFTHTPDREHWCESQKWELHVSILEYIVYAHVLKGLVLTAGPDYGCVALWMPPGKNMDDLITIMRSGMWRLYYQLSIEGKARYFDEFFPLLHQTKANVLRERDDDSWYLVYIGTRPAAQKMGLAKKLIDHVTATADKEGRAAYLESSHATNVAYYRKRGFEIVKKIYLQRDHVPIELDIMVREPQSSKK